MVLACHVGFSRLHQFRFLKREPMLSGILGVARHLLQVQRRMRARVWAAADVWQFVVVARKTARLVEELNAAAWKSSPRTDADGQCEFFYQPEGWGKACRFLALRYAKKPEASAEVPEQYQLFDTPEYTYRVFVTGMEAPLDVLVGFYRGRASAENLIKKANNDAGLAAHPSGRWTMNVNWFQIVMLACNRNCWLLLFQRCRCRQYSIPSAPCAHRSRGSCPTSPSANTSPSRSEPDAPAPTG
jgi:hypothetical protein